MIPDDILDQHSTALKVLNFHAYKYYRNLKENLSVLEIFIHSSFSLNICACSCWCAAAVEGRSPGQLMDEAERVAMALPGREG